MKVAFKYLLFSFFSITMSLAEGQSVELHVKAREEKSQLKKLSFKTRFPLKSQAYEQIEEILNHLRYKGYLLASADTVYSDTNNVYAEISQNQVYKNARLKLGNLDPGLASKLGISEKLYTNKVFNYKNVARSFEKILVYYENNGFPFVAVGLDSVTSTGNELNAVINVQKNRLFKIDSVKVIGTATVNKKFLYRYLAIRQGMLYNEQAISGISQKVRQLPFVAEKQVQRVQLTDKKNKLILFLDKREASQFDGIVGLLPDADTKKTIITGDVKLKLVNGVLKNGETFDLQWRRLKTQTSDFNGRLVYPYLFGSPVGVDYALKIYRLDTTFIDVNNNIGIQYYFSGLNNIKLFYKQKNSSLISTEGFDFITTLPDYADIKTQAYGVGTAIEKLDYRFNPKKGVSLTVNAQVGNRIISKNPKINELAYKNVILKSSQYQGDIQLATYFSLYRNNVLKLALQGASIFGNASVFKNELFRIGGLRTLRGFDEESIFASTYVIPTIEYRFLFSQNSNILLFAEGAWYENNSNHSYKNDTPVSFGAGINFETKAGILSINYALGNQLGNGFDVRSGKIHFGLTALF